MAKVNNKRKSGKSQAAKPKQAAHPDSPKIRKSTKSPKTSRKSKQAKRTPTLRQQRAAEIHAEKLKKGVTFTKGEVLDEAGYPKSVQLHPQDVYDSLGFQEALRTMLPQGRLLSKHKDLLESKRLEHMVFPVAVTDEIIIELIHEIGGVMRRIMHGETANHVWFWMRNDGVVEAAVALGYKLHGVLNADRPLPANPYAGLSDTELQKRIEERRKAITHRTNTTDGK